MKKLVCFISLVCFLSVGISYAQDEEKEEENKNVQTEQDPPKEEKRKLNKGEIRTISGNNYHSGGFGAVAFKGGDYLDQTLVMAGIRGGWIINRAIAMGFEGWGIIPTVRLTDVYPFSDVIVLGGYGGFFIEPIFFSNEIVHFTLPVSAGAGWIGYQETAPNFDYYGTVVSEDVYWYVEPGIALELNVSRHFRMDFGVSKRFTQDFDMINTPSDAFDELSYFLTLKFGGF